MWPDWIEELKRRYLAEEASVFLLHGAVDVVAWPYEDELLDALRFSKPGPRWLVMNGGDEWWWRKSGD